MKYFFVSKVHGLEINRTLNKGIQVIDNLRLSNSRKRIESKADDFFIDLVGMIEYDSLLSGPYLYAEGEYDLYEEKDREDRLELLNYFMRLSQTLPNALWTIKDNSVKTELGFLYVYDQDKELHFQQATVSSNTRASYFLNSHCENANTNFTFDEISECLSNYTLIFDQNTADLEHSEAAGIITTKANRIERFIYFLQSARTQSFLPNRISSYCTALETLFSTDNQEISHKMSERIARIIGEDFPSREKVFKFMKTAYSVRSSYVHGDKLHKKYRDIEEQSKISSELDEYVRQLYNFITSDDEIVPIYLRDNQDELIQYFNKITLA
jgi:Apea-like HEPN